MKNERVRRSAGRGLVLPRPALGADVPPHLPHLANAHVVRNLDFDLVVVDYLGDLADEPAIGDDGVATPHVLDHLLMRLPPLLLRTQDQEIHERRGITRSFCPYWAMP